MPEGRVEEVVMEANKDRTIRGEGQYCTVRDVKEEQRKDLYGQVHVPQNYEEAEGKVQMHHRTIHY